MALVDTSCGIVGEDSIAYGCLHTCILYFFSHATAPCVNARLANICKYWWVLHDAPVNGTVIYSLCSTGKLVTDSRNLFGLSVAHNLSGLLFLITSATPKRTTTPISTRALSFQSV